MNKWLVFLGGVLTGFLLTILVSMIIVNKQSGSTGSISENSGSNDITKFDEPGDVVEDNNFKVFQVLADDAALVTAAEDKYDDMYLGKVYLMINNEGKYYYDDEIIKEKEGKVFRQVGIYRYPTKNERVKTVPIIMMMDK